MYVGVGLHTSKLVLMNQLMFLARYTDMFEERALLLSRLEKHELALAIYVHGLKQPELAEE